MAEKSRFFDSTEHEVQEYNADQFAEYFRRIIGNGVFYERRQLQPSAGPDGTSIRIDEGYAWINGYLYIVDGGGYSLYVQPTSSSIRVDRVVLRLDKRAGHGYIKAFVKQGTPGSPNPPTLTRNENVYELSLCLVKVAEKVTENNVIDEREDPDVCGFVTLGATEGGKPRPIQWVEPALGANFTPATSYMPVAYGKDDIGFVHLRGVAMVKTHAQTAKLFELPRVCFQTLSQPDHSRSQL
ncbi:hypothetical protein ABNF65_21450 [Paenibacillus larvae]